MADWKAAATWARIAILAVIYIAAYGEQCSPLRETQMIRGSPLRMNGEQCSPLRGTRMIGRSPLRMNGEQCSPLRGTRMIGRLPLRMDGEHCSPLRGTRMIGRLPLRMDGEQCSPLRGTRMIGRSPLRMDGEQCSSLRVPLQTDCSLFLFPVPCYSLFRFWTLVVSVCWRCLCWRERMTTFSTRPMPIMFVSMFEPP